MDELLNCCRICLQMNPSNVSLYQHFQQQYLPSVIENICGIVLSPLQEPQALICKECAEAIVNADSIILKCQESDKILTEQRKMIDNMNIKCKSKGANNWFETDINTIVPDCTVKPEMLVEAVLGSYLQEESNEHEKKENNDFASLSDSREKRKRKQKLSFKKLKGKQEFQKSNEKAITSLYQSHFKISKSKKAIVRSREQYLKRKIRNCPVKEPLKLIGEAGVERKRKPKAYHRAIPNFYFCCELCHEFESNVASYAVAHLNTIHGIERPAIFRCPQCDIKPFIKNQSLQEHIATIHEQQPKKRDFICQECGKTFIKNCHLQKHLLCVHKTEALLHKCEILKCNSGFGDINSLRLHMKLSHHIVDEEKTETLTTLYQCDSCKKSFIDIQGLKIHTKSVHPDNRFNCLLCGFNFREKARYDAHVKRAKCKPPLFVCRCCEKTFLKLVELEDHQKKVH